MADKAQDSKTSTSSASSEATQAEGASWVPKDETLANELLEGNGPKGVPTGDPIMSVRNLKVSFNTEAGRVDAVRSVNFAASPSRWSFRIRCPRSLPCFP